MNELIERITNLSDYELLMSLKNSQDYTEEYYIAANNEFKKRKEKNPLIYKSAIIEENEEKNRREVEILNEEIKRLQKFEASLMISGTYLSYQYFKPSVINIVILSGISSAVVGCIFYLLIKSKKKKLYYKNNKGDVHCETNN